MPKPRDFIPRTLSARIILQTVFSISLLLIPTVLAMVIGTRLLIREEAGRQVDQALDGIAYRLDNTFLEVEQTAAIIGREIPNLLDRPQELNKLCRKALEVNPSITGCAIALNPDYYTSSGEPFRAYIHRAREGAVSANSRYRPLLSSESFTAQSFTEQAWYAKPIREGVPSWVGPLRNEETEGEPLLSYDIPIVLDSTAVGVIGVDMSLSVLTQIAQNYKTSTHSYITLLDREGSYIVHPDSTRLLHISSLAQLRDVENPSVLDALQEMIEGKSGRREFMLDSTRYLMAYRPFQQSAYPGRRVGNLGWSIAVFYPEKELYTEFDPGYRLSILMIVVSLLLLVVGAAIIAHVSLRPLRRLMRVTQIISKGNYRLPGFETSRTDEVGRLQTLYNKMLQAVADHMEQLQNLSEKEIAYQDALAQTYERTKEIKKHKADFFGKMTHQMADVTAEIQDSVDKLCEFGADMGDERTGKALDKIEKNGHRVTEILNDLLNLESRDVHA